MSKHHKQKKESKKAHRRQNARRLVTITSVLILLLAGWLWYDSLEENNDLTAIGQGENVVVQVHDPG
jgi:membrane protein involved in colicin uptake